MGVTPKGILSGGGRLKPRRAAAEAFLLTAMIVTGLWPKLCWAQARPGASRLCILSFDKDTHLPARVEDGAKSCLEKAAQAISMKNAGNLYLVGAADRVKDNQAMHGRTRTEQDMTGDDLRYADVAAYRALNTKAYLVRWLGADPTRIVPLTTYEDGQWAEVYLVSGGRSFKTLYGRQTAPILSRPCTVKPCAAGPEEFLIAQQREKIASK